ncbi:MAG: L-lactate permease [Alicyclobacillus sp.]|nr:L-lactate permease [Alicyclobacillus sp.]
MSTVYTVIAVLPILLTLICLTGLRMSSVKTAGLAYVVAVVIAEIPWKFQTSVKWIMLASVKGLLIALIVIYVLVFGLFLYNILREGRAIDAFSNLFARYVQSPVQQALLVSAALGPFLEATTGFGIGIVIAAPLYLAMRFQPQKVAILSLLTQSAVPWGALAVGTVLNSELSGVPLRALGVGSAIVTIPLYLLYTIVAVCVAGGWGAVWRNVPIILLVWAFLCVFTWAANDYVSPQLAGVLSGFVTAVLLLIYFRFTSSKINQPIQKMAASDEEEKAVLPFWKSVFPYSILIVFSLAANLWPILYRWLHTVLVWRVPSLQFQLELLYSPGFTLLLASIAGIVMYRLSWTQVCDCAIRTIKQVYPAALSTVGFVAMSTVMQQAGMTDFFSHHLAQWVGKGFLFVSPVIGGLGGFITGSNSASNAMFTPLQNAMAHELHHSPLLYAIAQNVAASNLTMESPSRIALAASIANLPGKEGDLTRRMIPLGCLVIVIIAIYPTIMETLVWS